MVERVQAENREGEASAGMDEGGMSAGSGDGVGSAIRGEDCEMILEGD